jgi:hypothetical protein
MIVWEFQLTPDHAKQVRQWCVDGATWRSVAHYAFEKWGAGDAGHQLFGRDLCNESARMLGEDPHAEPWN